MRNKGRLSNSFDSAPPEVDPLCSAVVPASLVHKLLKIVQDGIGTLRPRPRQVVLARLDYDGSGGISGFKVAELAGVVQKDSFDY